MTSGFVPLSYPVRHRVRARPAEDLRLARWALLMVVLLELSAWAAPQALLVSPIQTAGLFKRISGYAMLSLLVFAMAYGWLRRLPALSAHVKKLNALHQASGLLILLLLAAHVGAQPTGFLLPMFHAMAIGLGAGALRAVLGPKAPAKLATGLLVLHIGATCLVSAGALLHLYFVYAYTA